MDKYKELKIRINPKNVRRKKKQTTTNAKVIKRQDKGKGKIKPGDVDRPGGEIPRPTEGGECGFESLPFRYRIPSEIPEHIV